MTTLNGTSGARRRGAARGAVALFAATSAVVPACRTYNRDTYAESDRGCVALVGDGGCAARPAPTECPPGFMGVPGDPTPGIATRPFCVARYEMKIRGSDDGAQNAAQDPAFARAHTAESRAGGTPWVHVARLEAVLECGELGDRYTLITNAQWQTLARDIARTGANWSGGAVGVGYVNRGHSDATPLRALAAGPDADPCAGTGQTACADPTSPEFEQKRTHVLSTGEVIWDLAGNANEYVDSYPDGPASEPLWTRFSSRPFTAETGWEAQRVAFAPAEAHDSTHGMGNFYGGASNGTLMRGGPFFQGIYETISTGGSEGRRNVGIFYAHHHVQGYDATSGFRCTYAP